MVIFFRKKSMSQRVFIRPTHCANHISRYQMLEYYSWTSQNVASRVFIGLLLLCGGAHEASDYQTVRNRLSNATHHCVTQLPHDCTYCLPDLVALVLADDILIIFFSPLCLFAIFIRAPCRWSTASSFSVIFISMNSILCQFLCMLPTYVCFFVALGLLRIQYQ